MEVQKLEAGDLVGYADAAKLLGIPQNTLYGWVYQRAVPHVRLGPRMVRFSRKNLAAWLAERTVEVR